MALRLRRRPDNDLRADRLTLGLAVAAAGTVGAVIGGELLRLASRRRRSEREEQSPTGVLETAELALTTTGQVTQDAVAVAVEGLQATPRHELVLFNMLTGFVGALAVVRISTAGIRSGWWPFQNVLLGGRHIHHFVPGILLAFGAGATALVTQDEKIEKTLAIPFGVGVGLTLDEAALLLDLRDVYWTREGILSVQLSLGLAALLSGTILALRILRRGEEEAEAHDEIPTPPV